MIKSMFKRLFHRLKYKKQSWLNTQICAGKWTRAALFEEYLEVPATWQEVLHSEDSKESRVLPHVGGWILELNSYNSCLHEYMGTTVLKSAFIL